MAVAKLVCPHCRATLRPAKPVPEGRTVKCPKCEETFKAGGAGAPAVKPAGAPAKAEEEEDDAATYAVVRDEQEERKKADEEERKKRMKKRRRARAEGADDDEDDEDEEADDEAEASITEQYLRNLKSKDPRGPAQETVVGPGNWVLRTALIGFFGWVFYFIAFMLPVAFPTYEKTQDEYSKMKEKPAAGQKEEPKKESKEVLHWWSGESILHGGKSEKEQPEKELWSIALFLFVLALGVTQAALLAIASVKIQSLESYQWSVTGCILAIIPLTTVPWFVLLTATIDLLDSGIELGIGQENTWLWGLPVFLWGPVVGGICLSRVLQKHVRPGFEYKPD